MNTAKLTSSKFPERICLEGSKSYANRMLILAALNPEETRISNIPQARDVQDMLRCFKLIGLNSTHDGDSVIISNSFPACEDLSSNEVIEVPTGEGGTTSRFIMAMLALGAKKYQLQLPEELSNRPFTGLIQPLKDLGADIDTSENHQKISVQGGLNSGLKSIGIDCSKTTQFATAILLIAKQINLEVEVNNLDGSLKYLEMTKELVGQETNHYVIPIDMSSAGYPISWALFHDELIIEICYEIDNFQADSKIYSIIEMLGGEYSFSEDGLKILPLINKKHNIEIDGSECIDLIPTLSYLFSFLDVEFRLNNVKTLKYKECDRLSEVIRILDIFNIRFEYNADSDQFVIYGNSKTNRSIDTCIKTENDHRMVMFSALFLKHFGGGEVSPPQSVNKSFPSFFDLFT